MAENPEKLENILDSLLEMKKIEKNYFDKNLNKKEDFMAKLKKEEAELPYNINLLDEVHLKNHHVYKTAHSRILVKLLQYTDNGEYILIN